MRKMWSRFEDNFKMIKLKGTIVSVGTASGPVTSFDPVKLLEKNVKYLRPTYVFLLSQNLSHLVIIR